MAREIRPSDVTDVRFVYWPPESRPKGGRWLIFLNGNYDLLDRYWRALTPLCDAGVLEKIRATTTIDGPEGMISCHTEDGNDVEGVRRAAEAIREAIDYKYIMYYKKLDEFDERGRNLRYGTNDSNQPGVTTNYLHTVGGCLYEKVEYKRWRTVPRQH